MTSIACRVAKVVSSSEEKGWSQVHSFVPDEPEKLKSKGQLLAIIGLKKPESGENLAALGREVITRLHEEYYGSVPTSSFVDLKAACQKVAQETGVVAGIEIEAAVLVEGVLYLCFYGPGQLVLKREEKMAVILRGKEGAMTSASGFLKAGDRLLLGSADFFSEVALPKIEMALSLGNPEASAEVLAADAYQGGVSGLVAAIIGQAKEEGSIPEKKNEFFQKVIDFLSQRTILLKMRRPDRQKKQLITIALVLLLMLGVSVVLGSGQKKRIAQEGEIARIFEEAKAKKNEGESLLSLDEAKARVLLEEADSLAKQIDQKGEKGEEFMKFKEELAADLQKVVKERLVTLQLFFDLGLIKEGAISSESAYSDGNLVFLDDGKKAVYQVGLGDKKSAVLAGGEDLKGAELITASWPKVFVLTETGIWQIEAGQKPKLVIKADNDWSEIVDLASFSGNLYLLTKKGLFQYPAIEGGFGSKKAWLKGEAPDFSPESSLAIDGSLWVLGNGQITKFTRGVKDSFNQANLTPALSADSSLFADFEQENIYVLDQGHSRVIKLAKDGQYLVSYFWQESLAVTGFAVLEKEAKMFLVAGSIIYETKLK